MLSTVVSDRQVPQNAMLLIAGLSLVIGLVGSQHSTLLITLVTFGALTAYILLHLAVLWHLGIRGSQRSWFAHVVSPVLGAAVLVYALWSADTNAKILGLAWMGVGVLLAVFHLVRGTLDAPQDQARELV